MKGELAIIYARVSTERQEDNTSLDAQVAACQCFAQQQGWVVLDVFRETFSGEFIYARPEFQRALQVLETGKVKHMIVDVPDRLGRGDAIPVIEYTIKNRSVEIHYVTGRVSTDRDSLAAVAQHSVDILVSGIERLKIRERTVRGRENTVRAGKVMTSHRPYGYSVVAGTLEIVEEEAAVLRQIFHWYVVERLSIRGIARRLHEARVPTPTERNGKVSKFGECSWSAFTIHHLLKTETYAGVWHYRKVRDTRKEVGASLVRTLQPRPPEERIAVAVPAILSREMWSAAQERLHDNQKTAKGRLGKDEYLLRRIIFCACGRRMAVRGTRWISDKPYNAQRYFYCTSAFGIVGEKRCPNRKTIRMDIAEKLVWDYIEQLLLDPRKLLAEIETRRETLQQKHVMVRDRVVMISQELSGIETKQKMLLDLYLNGDLSREDFTVKKGELQRKRQDLVAERQEKESWLKEQGLTDSAKEQVQAFCAEVAEGMKQATLAEKRQILQMLEVKVSFDGAAVTIGGGVPAKNLFTSS